MFNRSTDEPDTETVPTSPLEGWMQLAELHAPITDLVQAHRDRLVASGFSTAAAEMMSAQYHATLCSLLVQSTKS